MDGSENSAVEFTGIVKYAAALAQGQIGAEEFLAGIRPIFAEIDVAFVALRGELETVEHNFENEDAEYIKSLLQRTESCRALINMASVFFEAFAAGEEPAGLRLGMQLLNKGNAVFQRLVETNSAKALGNGLYGSKIAVCSVASEVMDGRLSYSNYGTALAQLKAIFTDLTDQAEAVKAELIEKCMILKDAAPEERKPLVRDILQILPKLEQIFGTITLSVYSPEYVKKTMSDIAVDKEING